MVRTVNATVHAVRRDAIVDAAERLIRAKGYEQMSVQDVQDELRVSRGAIYHYFHSKSALLEAVAERMANAVMATMTPIAADPDLPAVAKLQRVYSAAGQWKAERKELVLALLRAWYSDDNAVARERLRRAVRARLTPLLADIVRQGNDEGVFSASSPDQAAAILLALLEADPMSRLLVAGQADAVRVEDVEGAMAAYGEAVERILGLPAGSFELIDAPTVRFWFAEKEHP